MDKEIPVWYIGSHISMSQWSKSSPTFALTRHDGESPCILAAGICASLPGG